MATPDQIRRRARWLLTVGAIAALAVGGNALADNVAPSLSFEPDEEVVREALTNLLREGTRTPEVGMTHP